MKNVIKYTKQYRFILNGTLNSYMRTTYDLRFKSNEVYLRKCKQVNILPLLYRFMFNDMKMNGLSSPHMYEIKFLSSKFEHRKKNWTVKVLKSIKIGHINLGRGWGATVVFKVYIII